MQFPHTIAQDTSTSQHGSSGRAAHDGLLVPAVRHLGLPRLVRHEVALGALQEDVAAGVADEEVELAELEARAAELLLELLVGEDGEQADREAAVCTTLRC